MTINKLMRKITEKGFTLDGFYPSDGNPNSAYECKGITELTDINLEETNRSARVTNVFFNRLRDPERQHRAVYVRSLVLPAIKRGESTPGQSYVRIGGSQREGVGMNVVSGKDIHGKSFYAIWDSGASRIAIQNFGLETIGSRVTQENGYEGYHLADDGDVERTYPAFDEIVLLEGEEQGELLYVMESMLKDVESML